MFGEMIGTISDFMYSYLLIIMLLAVGLYFTIRTRGRSEERRVGKECRL